MLRANKDGVHEIVKQYLPSQQEKYSEEVRNLREVSKAFASKDLPFISFTPNDDDHSITFHLVGYGAAINNEREAINAHGQLKTQLVAAHECGFTHDDVSPRNIVMSVASDFMDQHKILCETVDAQFEQAFLGEAIPTAQELESFVSQFAIPPKATKSAASVSYHLIDWAEAETLESDKTFKKAITILCSYPLPPTATAEEKKNRDLYALNCSIIVIYAQGRRIQDDLRWDKNTFRTLDDGSLDVDGYVTQRENLLRLISSGDNPYPGFLKRLADECLQLRGSIARAPL